MSELYLTEAEILSILDDTMLSVMEERVFSHDETVSLYEKIADAIEDTIETVKNKVRTELAYRRLVQKSSACPVCHGSGIISPYGYDRRCHYCEGRGIKWRMSE